MSAMTVYQPDAQDREIAQLDLQLHVARAVAATAIETQQRILRANAARHEAEAMAAARSAHAGAHKQEIENHARLQQLHLQAQAPTEAALRAENAALHTQVTTLTADLAEARRDLRAARERLDSISVQTAPLLERFNTLRNGQKA